MKQSARTSSTLLGHRTERRKVEIGLRGVKYKITQYIMWSAHPIQGNTPRLEEKEDSEDPWRRGGW